MASGCYWSRRLLPGVCGELGVERDEHDAVPDNGGSVPTARRTRCPRVIPLGVHTAPPNTRHHIRCTWTELVHCNLCVASEWHQCGHLVHSVHSCGTYGRCGRMSAGDHSGHFSWYAGLFVARHLALAITPPLVAHIRRSQWPWKRTHLHRHNYRILFFSSSIFPLFNDSFMLKLALSPYLTLFRSIRYCLLSFAIFFYQNLHFYSCISILSATYDNPSHLPLGIW